MCREVGPHTSRGLGRGHPFRPRDRRPQETAPDRTWTTGAIGLVPALSPQAIAWEQEAARVTFDLDRVLLDGHRPRGDPRRDRRTGVGRLAGGG